MTFGIKEEAEQGMAFERKVTPLTPGSQNQARLAPVDASGLCRERGEMRAMRLSAPERQRDWGFKEGKGRTAWTHLLCLIGQGNTSEVNLSV